jgi:hypothetical protein
MVLSLALGALTSIAQAQTGLPDPTRPPVGLSADSPEAEGAMAPVLQSVMIPKTGKPIAIIGGRQVSLGGMYGESRLIKLTEQEAVLKGPAGIECLLLTPDARKTNMIIKLPAATRAQSGSKP